MVKVKSDGRVSRRGGSGDWIRQSRLAIILVVPVMAWTLLAGVVRMMAPLL